MNEQLWAAIAGAAGAQVGFCVGVRFGHTVVMGVLGGVVGIAVAALVVQAVGI